MAQASTLVVAVISLITMIFRFPHIVERSAHRSDPRCDAVHELVKYAADNTAGLDVKFEKGLAVSDDYQQWADGIQRQAAKLDERDKAAREMLVAGSREIVALAQYAQLDPTPVSDEKPPPRWIRRYDDVSEQFEFVFTVLKNECS